MVCLITVVDLMVFIFILKEINEWIDGWIARRLLGSLRARSLFYV